MRDPKTDSLARGANELAIELERVVGMPVISRLAPAVALDPRAAPTRARRAPAVECLWVNAAPSQEINGDMTLCAWSIPTSEGQHSVRAWSRARSSSSSSISAARMLSPMRAALELFGNVGTPRHNWNAIATCHTSGGLYAARSRATARDERGARDGAHWYTL